MVQTRYFIRMLVLFACVSGVGVAHAQAPSNTGGPAAPSAPTAAPTAGTGGTKSRVITISEVTIVGRIQKPIASVDVSRIQPKLTLAELRQPFLQRIEDAVYRAPF